ncbi:hypothetical protein [Natrinema salaciae]|uniref:Uncharacterized protein n=1 Tax=Natrinema salaciae TaxID=1186196 RepID=A0A1H9JKI3_9EURY|nr:hypothetical protein [Natrinema salaciae]SEQ87309.1 hypothetical protein SAMN04489841_2593 [Natrinema salaciae]
MPLPLRSKLFGSGGWNNNWYFYIGSPAFALLGALLYWLFGVHLASSEVAEPLVMVLFLGATVTIGCAMLAVIDER